MGNKDYGELLSSAIHIADRQLAGQGGISRKYGIRPVGVDMISSALSEGWDAFDELAARMDTGYLSYSTGIGAVLGAAIAPAALLGSAIGMIGKSLSFWGGDEKAVSSMYDNKSLILAVHRIGQSKLSKFTRCQNDENKLLELKEDIVGELINQS
jgi:hypothetical protein